MISSASVVFGVVLLLIKVPPQNVGMAARQTASSAAPHDRSQPAAQHAPSPVRATPRRRRCRGRSTACDNGSRENRCEVREYHRAAGPLRVFVAHAPDRVNAPTAPRTCRAAYPAAYRAIQATEPSHLPRETT